MSLGVVVNHPAHDPPPPPRPAAPQVSVTGPSTAPEITPTDLITYVWRRKILVVLITFALSLLALLAIRDMQPTFTASTTLMFDPQLSAETANEGNGNFDNEAVIEGQIQIIESRGLAGRVIDTLGLMDSTAYNPALDTSVGLRDRIRALIGGGGAEDTAPPDEAFLRARAIDTLLGGLDADQVGESRVIAISFTADDRAHAASVANTAAELYITQQLDARLATIRSTNDWLSDRMADMRVETEAAERRLADYTAELTSIGDRDPATIDRELESLNERTSNLRSTLASSRARLTQIDDIYQSQGARAASALVVSGVADQMRGQVAGLEQQRAQLASQLGTQHPTIVNMNSQIAIMAAELDQIVRAEIQSLDVEVTTAEQELASLQADQQALLDIRRQVDQGEAQLRVLEREAEAARSMFDALLNRSQEAQEAALGTPEAFVISEASEPVNANGPGRTTMMLAAMMAAGMAAVAAAIALEILSGTFNSSEEVERAIGLRVLGSVPRHGSRFRSHKPVPLDGSTLTTGAPLSVALRAIISGVDAIRGTPRPGLVLLVTSGQERDGKTALSLMLASHFVSLNLRPIVIDADLERAHASRAMNAQGRSGLSEMLAGRMHADEGVAFSSRWGFRLLPAGRTPNQEIYLGSPDMAELIRRMRLEYDAVIIDAAESYRHPEARQLADHVDAQIMVVHWRRSLRRRVRRAVGRLIEARSPLAAVLVGMPTGKIG